MVTPHMMGRLMDIPDSHLKKMSYKGVKLTDVTADMVPGGIIKAGQESDFRSYAGFYKVLFGNSIEGKVIDKFFKPIMEDLFGTPTKPLKPLESFKETQNLSVNKSLALFEANPQHPIVVQAQKDLLKINRNAQVAANEIKNLSNIPFTAITQMGMKYAKMLENLNKFYEQQPVARDLGDYNKELSFIDLVKKQLVNKIIRFGEAYNKGDFRDQALQIFYELNGAIDVAMLEVKKIFTQLPKLTIEEFGQLSIAYELDDTRILPPQNVQHYVAVKGLQEYIESAAMKAGLKFSYKERRDTRLKEIEEELLQPKLSKKAKENLLQEQRLLKEAKQYMSHSPVLQKFMDSAYSNSTRLKRKKLIGDLQAFHKKRKGKYTLQEYLDEGIITFEDINPIKLFTHTLTDVLKKQALKNFVDYAKKEGLIITTSKKKIPTGSYEAGRPLFATDKKTLKVLRPENYIDLKTTYYQSRLDLPPGTKVHYYFDAAMKNYIREGSSSPNYIAQLFAAVKIGQFYNPFIIAKYNALQQFLGNMFVWNAAKQGKLIAEGVGHVITRSEFYVKCVNAGLFQPSEMQTIRDANDRIELFTRKFIKTKGNKIAEGLVSMIDNATTQQTTSLFKGLPKDAREMLTINPLKDDYKAISTFLKIHKQ